MTLNPDQQDEVREKVIKQFGLEFVLKMDAYYAELNDIRMTCCDSYEFLDKVVARYEGQNHELVLASILYGMRQGELSYEYFLRRGLNTETTKPLPKFGHAQ